MDIKIIVPSKESDFNNSINLLNKIFSKYPNAHDYSSEFAYDKTIDHDPLIIEAYENSQLIGFALCYQRYPNLYHIWDLGVEELFRGKGIASKIYDEVEKYAQKKGYLGVSLNTFNRFKENIRLLIKRGYEIYDLEKDSEFEDNPKIMLKLRLK